MHPISTEKYFSKPVEKSVETVNNYLNIHCDEHK